MPKLAMEVSSYPRADGTRSVYIRVSHLGKARRLPTTLVVRDGDLTRSGRLKNRAIKEKCDVLIKEMYSAIEDISYFDLENCDVDYIVERIRNKHIKENFSLEFIKFASDYVERIKNLATRKTYTVALSAFKRFLSSMHRSSIDINDITSDLLRHFISFLNEEPKYYYRKCHSRIEMSSQQKKRGTAAKAYLIKLGRVFSEAKKIYNDEDACEIKIPRSPFRNVDVSESPSHAQKPLGLEAIRKIVKAETDNPYERAALDAFVVSFGLMGPNMADLYYAIQPVNNIWTYERSKTRERRKDRAEMHVMVPGQLKPYLARLTANANQHAWLNLSWRYSSVASASKTIGDILKRWAKRNGLPPFTLAAARKTWATIARSRVCGIDKATVDECLAHVGDLKIADIYIERDWAVLWQANNTVCQKVFDE